MTDSVTVTLPRSLVDDLRERRPHIHGSPDNVVLRLADAVLSALDSAPDAPAADASDEEMVSLLASLYIFMHPQTVADARHVFELSRYDVERILSTLATLRERAERESDVAEKLRIVQGMDRAALHAAELALSGACHRGAQAEMERDSALARAAAAERERDEAYMRGVERGARCAIESLGVDAATIEANTRAIVRALAAKGASDVRR